MRPSKIDNAILATEYATEGERNFMVLGSNSDENLERHVKDIFLDKTYHFVSYQAPVSEEPGMGMGPIGMGMEMEMTYLLFNKEKFLQKRFPLLSDFNSEYMAVVMYDEPNWFYAGGNYY